MGNDGLLLYFSQYGNCNLVKLLIPVSNPMACDSWALQLAAYYGHTECVRLLIPVSAPMDDNSFALKVAAQNGHTECVRLLIPVSGPKASDSLALQLAAQNGHTECVKLLKVTKGSYICGIINYYYYIFLSMGIVILLSFLSPLAILGLMILWL